MGKRSKGHAIMISLPYQGHINPFTSLALKLASKGFTVTFVHLEFIHRKLSEARGSTTTYVDCFAEARESGLDIRYSTINDCFPLEFDRDLHVHEYWKILLRDFPARVDTFVGEMIHQSDAVQYFLVTDTVYSWPAVIADKYNIVNVSFWTEPALVFSLLYHWDLLIERGHYLCKDKMEEINYVPGVKSIHTGDLMSYLRKSDLAHETVYNMLSQAFKQAKKADFILHNTVEELEPDILSALNKHKPNYAVGPINFSKSLASKGLWNESDCTRWLDSKPPGSVLYVSFGSVARTNKQIIEEIAYGLLLSEVNFIWAIRPNIVVNSGDANAVLPVGFKDGIKDKGLIVPWCDQITILSNPAVGGFLTHNGWNSTVESTWCGVPMICYPLTSDQPTNRKLVVDDWKTGISLCDGECVDRAEVAEKIKNVMSGDSVSNGLKVNANKLKGILRNALENGGTSDINFDRFVQDLEAEICAKTANMEKLCEGGICKFGGSKNHCDVYVQ